MRPTLTLDPRVERRGDVTTVEVDGPRLPIRAPGVPVLRGVVVGGRRTPGLLVRVAPAHDGRAVRVEPSRLTLTLPRVLRGVAVLRTLEVALLRTVGRAVGVTRVAPAVPPRVL
jgi:hypothetical protein